jgi:hypothetical protein
MPHSKEAFNPPVVETEYQVFERWWTDYAKTLNARATLTWIELAWAGWWARSEKAEGKEPTIYPRRGGE